MIEEPDAQAQFAEDVTAYLTVRDLEAAATTVETEALHTASTLAKEAGMSVRAAANDLRVPHAKVFRHLKEKTEATRDGRQCTLLPRVEVPLEHLKAARARVVTANPPTTSSALATFLRARARAEALRYERARTLRLTLVDGKDGVGLSIRKVAALLGVPHATAARAYLADEAEPPVWADAEALLEAQRATWAHAPHRPEFQEERVSHEWTDHPDGSRSVRSLPMGVARRRGAGE